MTAYGAELFSSYNDVVARREWEIGLIKEKLEKGEVVDLPLCRIERVTAGESTVRFGLKRGKLLYVFKYPTHDVERDKHRNVVTRARFIKEQLELAGYRLIPWDFKKGQPPKFWGEGTMEEEDDDLYGPSETAAPAATTHEEVKNEDDASSGDEPMDEGLESGEEDESDSDSDIEIIIDKPSVASKPVQSAPRESTAIKIEAPPQPTATQTQAPKSTPLHLPTGQPGTAYPAVRTSTIDVNADPVYPPLGKPISQVDIDADLAEATKPWRLPGADQSDYFNYGFDEFTWEMYRQRQQTMASNLAQQKAETAQLQQFFGSMGPGAAPAGAAAPTGPGPAAGGAGAGAGPANMPMAPGGMNEEMMANAFQQMMAQGMDPSTMDFGAFMSMAGGGGMPGFGAPAGPQGGFGGGGSGGNQGGGGGGAGGRRGGRGRGNW